MNWQICLQKESCT
uniref:Uncharacterized protein n=1 Tax=Timema monikensis TaxID=170555 RepID=A0A7R9EMA0_9NEOP|nr:unnamed protein product [Timema monikensis]